MAEHNLLLHRANHRTAMAEHNLLLHRVNHRTVIRTVMAEHNLLLHRVNRRMSQTFSISQIYAVQEREISTHLDKLEKINVSLI